MEYEVKTRLDGAEVHRRGERVVDERDEVIAARERDDAFEIRNVEQRVGHRFDVDGLGIRAQLSAPRACIVRIDEIYSDAEL